MSKINLDQIDYVIVCEDDTVVLQYNNMEDFEEFKPGMLGVRIDYPDGDGEFVSVAELADMYRELQVKRMRHENSMRRNKELRTLYQSTDLPNQQRMYKWLADETGMFETDLSNCLRSVRPVGEKRYKRIKAALLKYMNTK